jgi:hypothetical protein
MAQLSSIFSADGNVTSGIIDCERFRETCKPAQLPRQGEYDEGSPGLMMIINGTLYNYTGPRLINSFVKTVNRECGTHRRIDGLLNDWAGTIKGADDLAKEFMNATDKNDVVQKMKTIEGAGYYVRVMERYLQKGVAQIKADVLEMRTNMENRKLSFSALDAMKQHYNVFMRFLPGPTPRPISSRKFAQAAPVTGVDVGADEIGETLL